jgi:hypothetical protein
MSYACICGHWGCVDAKHAILPQPGRIITAKKRHTSSKEKKSFDLTSECLLLELRTFTNGVGSKLCHMS